MVPSLMMRVAHKRARDESNFCVVVGVEECDNYRGSPPLTVHVNFSS